MIGQSILNRIKKQHPYEPQQAKWVKSILKRGMIVIDAGANVGFYSLLASKRVGDTGQVIAIEPSFREFMHLSDNIKGYRNIIPWRIALSDIQGQATLQIADDEHPGHNTLSKEFGDRHVVKAGMEYVCTLTLDDIVGLMDLPQVDLIKLDVEGAEYLTLKGAAKTLQQFKPLILIEIADGILKGMGTHGLEIHSFLRDSGYELYQFNHKGLELITYQNRYSANYVALPNS